MIQSVAKSLDGESARHAVEARYGRRSEAAATSASAGWRRDDGRDRGPAHGAVEHTDDDDLCRTCRRRREDGRPDHEGGEGERRGTAGRGDGKTSHDGVNDVTSNPSRRSGGLHLLQGLVLEVEHRL